MAASVTTTGFEALQRRMRSLSGALRATSAKAAEVAPASADEAKAVALVRAGRNVFAVDPEMERAAFDAFDERADRELERAMSGSTGSMAACLVAAAEAVKALVQDRIDDVAPTPGGKAALKAPRRDGSTDHIGRDTGALHNGLVARLVR